MASRPPEAVYRATAAWAAFLAVGLLVVGAGLLPGRVMVPLDLLSDLGAWKADVHEPRAVSNRLLSDAVLQLAPWDEHARRSLARGEIPWTNPWSGEGRPFLTNPQTALLSPFTWPRLVLGDGGWAWTVLLKTVVGAAGVAALAIEMGATSRAATLSGCVYALSGFSIVWGLYPLTNVTSLLPWLAALALRAVTNPSRPALLLVALAAALATAGGQPEMLFQGVVGLAVLVALEKPPARALARCAGAALAGFLLVAPLWLPFVLALGSSASREGRLAVSSVAIRPGAVVAQLLPGFLGSPLARELDLSDLSPRLENLNERSAGFFGGIALTAVLLSARRLTSSMRRGLLIGAVSLVVAWGVPPFAMLLRLLPGFSMAANERLAWLGALFGSVAAGPAFEQLRGRCRSGVVLAIAGLVLLSIGALPSIPLARPAIEKVARAGIGRLRETGRLTQPAAAYEGRLVGYLDRGRATALRRIALPGACWLVAGLALASAWRARSTLLVGAALIELLGFGLGYLPAVERTSIPGPPVLVAEMKRLDPGRRFLYAAGPGILPPELGTLYELRDVRSYDVLESRERLASLAAAGYDGGSLSFRRSDAAAQRRLAALGVRFILSRDPLPGAVRVGGGEPPAVGLYELADAVPSPLPANRAPPGLGTGVALAAVGAALALAAAFGGRAPPAVGDGPQRLGA